MSAPVRNSGCVINVINPNMTETMTKLITKAAQDCAGTTTRIIGRTARFGAASIEGHYDEALATIGMLKEIAAGNQAGCDVHVIACFGDPGLLAARTVGRPVLGIAEAAMHAPSFVATHSASSPPCPHQGDRRAPGAQLRLATPLPHPVSRFRPNIHFRLFRKSCHSCVPPH